MEGYATKDIYNGDETALFYKCLPHRTYCFEGDKLAGSAKHKDRLTLLIITNMDGSDHRKLSVIGKAKNPCCLQKKYKMQVKDMVIDWCASKNAWITGEIHDRIMTKFNNQIREAGRKVLYVCDNASSHGKGEYSNIRVLRLPPNATSIIQPLDHGKILSVKRRYKKKLAERYLTSVETNKDANAVLTSLEMDTLDLINTTMASSAINALLDNIIMPGRTSTPIRKKPIQTPGNSSGMTSTQKRKNPEPSTSQKGPKKKLKMTAAAAREQLMNMRDSDVSSISTEASDTQLLISSQE